MISPYYQDEYCTIYNADCMEILGEMSPAIADTVLTDPPYSTPVAISFGRTVARSIGDLSMQATYMKLFSRCIQRSLTNDGRAFIFCDDDYYPVLHTVFYEWSYRQLVVWDKGQIGMGTCFRRQHELIIHATAQTGSELQTWGDVTSHRSILKFPPVPSANRVHGAQKPLALIKYLLQAAGTKTVLDPFMGSGTTLVAAKSLGLKAIGIEIEERYCRIAVERLRQESLLPLMEVAA